MVKFAYFSFILNVTALIKLLIVCVFLIFITLTQTNSIQIQDRRHSADEVSLKNIGQPTRKPAYIFKPSGNPTTSLKQSRKPTLHFQNTLDRNSSHGVINEIPKEPAKPEHPTRTDRISEENTDSGFDVPIDELPNLKVQKSDKKKPLTVGLVLPATNFQKRKYLREIGDAFLEFYVKNNNSDMVKKYDFKKENVIVKYMAPSSAPITILGTLCQDFLSRNVSAILYLFNTETFGRSTASVQYFFQLASYLGIPVISWNADNSGLERRLSSLQLQLAPSIEHQAAAMLSILQRYAWPKFAIVTTQIAGHNDFVQAVRDVMRQKSKGGQEFTILDVVTVTVGNAESDIENLIASEARIIFLYSTRDEAAEVLSAAANHGLTGKNYLWIVTQSVIQGAIQGLEAPKEFPVGMLGVHFGTSDDDMISEIKTALTVFGTGVRDYVDEEELNRNALPDLSPTLSCETGAARWPGGANFYRFLRDVKFDIEDEKKKHTVEFNADGSRKYVQLKIMNLRSDITSQNIWEEIGVWNSAQENGLDVKDVIWPGHSHVPPNGIPEKFHLKITFMEEPPFINMDPPHPLTGTCPANKGVLCRIATDEKMQGVNLTWAMRNPNYYRCCSGFCIDLLARFAEDLGFSYDFFRVEDGIWGAIVNGKWTGLPGAIITGKADMIMTSIKINSQREEVLDFSIPFLDTGITIVVSKRTGIISPTAFLEPFDSASWMLVAAVAIQVAAISIFIFEWLSPSGFNMKFVPPTGQRFSLLRTLWLVWAILFQAAVNIDVPRSVTSRVMGNVWAMFALIFLAIYTANLAAFMITREEYYDLSGIEDKKLQNPTTVKPPFRFGTTLHGNTDVILKKSFPEMHSYMRLHNQTTPIAGVKKVKKGELDAFLYDATVLEYLTGQDDECRLLTVGSWFALTGYGVAFRRNSKYVNLFNEQIMKYRESGYLERLSRFWFTGACQPEQQYKSSSKPLALEQFMSTFFLLGCGVVLGMLLLTVEHLHFKYFRYFLANWSCREFFSLISMSMGASLLFDDQLNTKKRPQESVHRISCENPICDMQLWKIKQDLDLARLRVYYLEEQLVATGIWKSSKRKKKVTPEDFAISPESPPQIPPENIPSTLRRNHSVRSSSSNSCPQSDSHRSGVRRRPPPENLSSGSSSSKCNSKIDLRRRKDLTEDSVTSTEIIRKPLLDKRDPDLEMAEIETVL